MLNANKKNLTDFILKYIHLFVIFNAVLVTYRLPYIYILAMFFILMLCLFRGIVREQVSSYVGFMGYIILLIVITFINMVFGTQDISALVTLGLYTLPIICWVFYFSKCIHNDFGNIFASLFIWTVIVALLGIVQYFFSPSLWGAIPTESKSILWAMEKPFIEYAAFFRATSTLGSPQVFGLFCALSLIIAHRFKYLFPKYVFLGGAVVLFLGGSLSGNKSFFLIVFLYFFAIFIVKPFKIRHLFFALSVGIAFVSTLHSIKSNIPMLERIFSFDKISEQEVNDSRLDKYSYIITNSNFFIGNGMGEDVVTRNQELTAAESYIFKIYFECGFFAALLLCLLMTMVMLKSWFKSFQDFIIVTLILVSMVIVHAFQSPVFFIFWGYLLSFFQTNKQTNKQNKIYN
jgi:hypothetical protein